jgi:subtilisin family serine protease
MGDNVAQDGNGHGTFVAGVAAGSTYGVAKSANIVGVRVLDDNGSGTTAGVIAGRLGGRGQRGDRQQRHHRRGDQRGQRLPNRLLYTGAF